jgi:hypothetical protein
MRTAKGELDLEAYMVRRKLIYAGHTSEPHANLKFSPQD